jgi:hypothetical protein
MQRPEDQTEIDLTEVATESPEESTSAERELVGEDQPDVGDTVSPDQAQSAHDDADEPTESDPPGRPPANPLMS